MNGTLQSYLNTMKSIGIIYEMTTKNEEDNVLMQLLMVSFVFIPFIMSIHPFHCCLFESDITIFISLLEIILYHFLPLFSFERKNRSFDKGVFFVVVDIFSSLLCLLCLRSKCYHFFFNYFEYEQLFQIIFLK